MWLGVTADLPLQNCYELLHSSSPPLGPSSTLPICCESCTGCLSCCTHRNVAIKCGNQDHLSVLPPRRWHTAPLTRSPTSVPNSSFLSACFASALRQHLNFPLLYTLFIVLLLLSKPLHLYSSFHFFLSSLLLCTIFTGISLSFPIWPLYSLSFCDIQHKVPMGNHLCGGGRVDLCRTPHTCSCFEQHQAGHWDHWEHWMGMSNWIVLVCNWG